MSSKRERVKQATNQSRRVAAKALDALDVVDAAVDLAAEPSLKHAQRLVKAVKRESR